MSEIEADDRPGKRLDQAVVRSGMRLALLIGILLPFFSQISGVNVIVYYGPKVLEDGQLRS